MKLNKKLLMAALAGAIIVTGGVGTYAADATNDAPGKTDSQKISEAQAKAKKQLDDAGVPFEKQKDVLAYPNNVYNIEQKTKEILAAKEKSDKELAKTELGKAKLAAKAELKKEGYHLGLYDEAINNATSLYDIEQVKEKVRANKSLKTIDDYNKEQEAKTRRLTIDEWLKLQKEKEDKKDNDKKDTDKKDNDKKDNDKKDNDKKDNDKKDNDKKDNDKKDNDKKDNDKKDNDKKDNDKKENNKKENTNSPKKKAKAKLPKAGSEAEIATLAAVALSTAAGAFVSLKKRK